MPDKLRRASAEIADDPAECEEAERIRSGRQAAPGPGPLAPGPAAKGSGPRLAAQRQDDHDDDDDQNDRSDTDIHLRFPSSE
jgi:hypothetical protein